MNPLGLAGLVVLCAFAEPSQPPPPTPLPTAEIKQENGDTDAPVSNPAAETPRAINCCGHANSQGDTRDQESSYNRAVAWLTAVLAFAALVQIAVTIAQAIFMRRGLMLTRQAADAARDSAEAAVASVGTAKEISQRDQRAWVTVQSIGFRAALEVGENPCLAVHVSNSGKSPALHVQYAGRVVLQKEISEADWSELVYPDTPSKEIIGPNATILAIFRGEKPIGNDLVLSAITLGDSFTNLCIFGEIRYEDIFKTPHKTTFSYLWGGEREGTDLFLAAERGNEAD